MTGLRAGALLLLAAAAAAAPLTLELPPETATFKRGPGSELADARCLTCHSADYVATQPPMPRPFWEAEVAKMREKYGADLPEGETKALVDYLAAAYGTEKRPPAAAERPVPAAPLSHADGAALAANYRCLSCHATDKKVVGPAFRDVAAKYAGRKDGRASVARQILHGGSGKWGSAVMPSFSTIPHADVGALADWILAQGR